MWRRIIAYLFFGLGFLTITFFKDYSGDLIPSPFLFWVLGFCMFLAGLLFLRYTPSSKELSNIKKVGELVADLKANGEKIKVDLSQCELKENHYSEEKAKYGHENELLTFDIEREIQLMNGLGGGSHRNIKQVQVIQTVILYTMDNARTGQKERFVSRVIPKDKVTLSFYLDKQKFSTLYIDKNNRERYYFDLDFLNS